jgi:NAD(P)-dependent dehydrogenase (short-subunit alcohol dehydrogenase family)
LAALVNNAAVQRLGRFTELSDEAWRQTMNVNLLAPILLIRGLYSDLVTANGAIVNISSIHATQTKPGFAAYAVSNGALAVMTQALAVELSGRVRVNAVKPAAIDTPMLRAGLDGQQAAYEKLSSYHPIGRVGRPHDIASLCVYLCSESAEFINGAVIAIDGGIGARLHDPS